MLLKNENITEDMISIMSSLHKYVPTAYQQNEYLLSTGQLEKTGEYFFHQLLLGGDQLTCARIRGSQTARISEEINKDRLLGLVASAEDWHTKVCLLEGCAL